MGLRPEHLRSSGPEYALAKLEESVRILAVGLGGLRDRLLAAAVPLVSIAPRDLPACLRDEFQVLLTGLTCRPARTVRRPSARGVVEESTGTLGATIATMRNTALVAAAECICNLCDRLRDDPSVRTSRPA